MRYIGVDLHTTQITVCYLKAEADFEIRKYQLVEMEKFVNTLELTDEIAVEATGNTRWFYEQVADKVGRVVLVNPRQFEVVRNSVKKTDKNDALNLVEVSQSGFAAGSAGKARRSRKGAIFGADEDETGAVEDEFNQ
jgi:transposase